MSVGSLRRGAELVDPALVELAVRDALWSTRAVELSASRAATDQLRAELDASKRVTEPAQRQGLVSTSVEAEVADGQPTLVSITVLFVDSAAKRPLITTSSRFSR